MLLAPARLLAFALPLALMAGALASQYWGGLFPCEMCMWQRWPLYGAIVTAGLAMVLRHHPATRPLTLLAGLLILASGLIGGFHAGVEYGWWKGPQHCTGIAGGTGADLLREIMAAPVVRCDVPQWTLAGISLAGWNFLFSVAGGVAVVILCLKPNR